MDAALNLIARERRILRKNRKKQGKENVAIVNNNNNEIQLQKENRELKRTVRDLSVLTKDLQSQLSHEIKMSSTITSSQKEELQQSHIRNDEKDLKIQTLEESLRRADLMLSEKSSKIKNIKEEMSDVVEKIKQTKSHSERRVNEFREMLRLEKERNEELERLLSTCLNDQMSKARSQVARTERELRGKMREQAERFQVHLQDANKIMKETLEKERRDFQREIGVLKEALDASRSVNEEYDERIKLDQMKIEEMRTKILSIESKNQDISGKTTTRIEELNRTIEELTSKQREGEMVSSDMLRMLRSAQQEARSRQQELCTLRKALEQERVQHEELSRKKISTAQVAPQFVDDAILRARTLTQKAKNVACQALTEQIQELTSENMELRQKNCNLESMLKIEKENSEKMKLKILAAEEMRIELVSTCENLRVSRDMIKTLQCRVKTLQDSKARCEKQELTIQEQSGKLAASKCALEASRTRLQKLEASESKLTEELDIVTSQLETLARRFAQCEEIKESLQEDNQALTSSLKRNEEELERERLTVQTMSATMKQNEMIVAELRERVEKNNEMLEISRKETSEAQTKEMTRLRSRDKMSRELVEERDVKIQDLETEIKRKNEYVKQLEVAVKTATETLKSLMKRRESEKLGSSSTTTTVGDDAGGGVSTATAEWRQRHQILNRYRSTPVSYTAATPRLRSTGRHLFDGGVGVITTKTATRTLGRSSLSLR